MTQTAQEGKLRLLEITYFTALISIGILSLSAGFQELDALRYVFLVLGVTLLVSPVVGLHKRIVGFIAARRGSSYITLALFSLPVGLVAASLVLAFFTGLGVDSGITSREEVLVSFMGTVIVILINVGVLVYNILESRQKTT
jgi:hypothetical protein